MRPEEIPQEEIVEEAAVVEVVPEEVMMKETLHEEASPEVERPEEYAHEEAAPEEVPGAGHCCAGGRGYNSFRGGRGSILGGGAVPGND